MSDRPGCMFFLVIAALVLLWVPVLYLLSLVGVR